MIISRGTYVCEAREMEMDNFDLTFTTINSSSLTGHE